MDMAKERLKAFEQLLSLTVCGAISTNEKIGLHVSEWQEIINLAAKHDVLPLLGNALLNHPEITCPEQYRVYLIDLARTQSAINLVRETRFFSLIKEMEQAKFDVCVIKGYILADYYAYPECRNSSDNDILVPVRQEKRVYEFLEEKGFKICARSKTRHHAVCQHPKYGVLEVHVHLYDEVVRESWFNGISEAELLSEPTQRMENQFGGCTTLGYTDHMMFIALHLIKHFIRSGIGIKMILDLMLFMRENAACIDIDRLWSILDHVHQRRFMNAVIGLMIQTGLFTQSNFPGSMATEKELVDALLADMLRGGYLGSDEMVERTECCDEYNRRMLLKHKGIMLFQWYMLSLKFRGAITKMFPRVEEIKRLYPKAEKGKCYMLYAYLRQMVAYPLSKLCKKEVRRQLKPQSIIDSSLARKRLELFEQLDML